MMFTQLMLAKHVLMLLKVNKHIPANSTTHDITLALMTYAFTYIHKN